MIIQEEAKRIEEEQRRERENREQRHLEDLEKDRQHEMAQKEVGAHTGVFNVDEILR